MLRKLVTLLFLLSIHVTATDATEKLVPYTHTVEATVKNQTLITQGRQLPYDVYVGKCSIPGKDEKQIANISYFAYLAENSADRPLAFCFNGGPGSSSIWLHMGALGPKIVKTEDLAHSATSGEYKNNPDSLLSSCDLVFIDPVSTGYSYSPNPEDEKPFFEVENDICSIANFIRHFLTAYSRWQSPKVIIGESYGSLRAVGITHLLQEKYFIDIHALGLISLVLNTEVSESYRPAPIPLITALPTLATIAHYHEKLASPLRDKSAQEVFDLAADFAVNEYSRALIAGSQLPKETEHKIAQQLSEFTSIPIPYIKQQHLRLTPYLFNQNFLDDQNLRIGDFDGRATKWKVPTTFFDCYSADPSMYNITSGFSSAFQTYLLNDLKYKKNRPYTIMSDAITTWKWGREQKTKDGFGFLDFTNDLRECFSLNPNLKVLVAAGLYDLATPAFSQKYCLNTLFLPESQAMNIHFNTYEAGHMMYLHPPSRKKFSSDLHQLVDSVKTPCHKR